MLFVRVSYQERRYRRELTEVLFLLLFPPPKTPENSKKEHLVSVFLCFQFITREQSTLSGIFCICYVYSHDSGMLDVTPKLLILAFELRYHSHNPGMLDVTPELLILFSRVRFILILCACFTIGCH